MRPTDHQDIGGSLYRGKLLRVNADSLRRWKEEDWYPAQRMPMSAVRVIRPIQPECLCWLLLGDNSIVPEGYYLLGQREGGSTLVVRIKDQRLFQLSSPGQAPTARTLQDPVSTVGPQQVGKREIEKGPWSGNWDEVVPYMSAGDLVVNSDEEMHSAHEIRELCWADGCRLLIGCEDKRLYIMYLPDLCRDPSLHCSSDRYKRGKRHRCFVQLGQYGSAKLVLRLRDNSLFLARRGDQVGGKWGGSSEIDLEGLIPFIGDFNFKRQSVDKNGMVWAERIQLRDQGSSTIWLRSCDQSVFQTRNESPSPVTPGWLNVDDCVPYFGDTVVNSEGYVELDQGHCSTFLLRFEDCSLFQQPLLTPRRPPPHGHCNLHGFVPYVPFLSYEPEVDKTQSSPDVRDEEGRPNYVVIGKKGNATLWVRLEDCCLFKTFGLISPGSNPDLSLDSIIPYPGSDAMEDIERCVTRDNERCGCAPPNINVSSIHFHALFAENIALQPGTIC